MRLIDADALKEYMDDCGWCDNCPDKKRLCEMDCRFPDFCTHEWQRVIDEQPTASPWHRCKDELPKDYGDYLGYADGEVMFLLFNPDTTDKWKWSACDAEGRFDVSVDEVTHWMPLPEPPKEE